MRFRAGMHSNIVSIGFDPIDAFNPDKNDPAILLKYQPIAFFGAGFQVLQKRRDLRTEDAAARAAQLLSSMTQRLLESRAVERFQKIIDGMNFERLQRI